MIKRAFHRITGIIGNLTAQSRGFSLAYITENCDWSIKHDGSSITTAINRQRLIKGRVTYCPCLLFNQLAHFGSIHTFIDRKGRPLLPHPSNKIILTWFHVEPHDRRLKIVESIQGRIEKIHTSCESTKRTLIESGIDARKIVVIPLGVDTSLFIPSTREQKHLARERLQIPSDRLVIGSFQKDGIGWGKGSEPKLIKGPDVFINTLVRLKHLHPFVLLTGPARGYVKAALTRHGIEYKHLYLKNIRELPEMYRALDVYLIPARIEGGPKSLLEAWASGVPVVSTRVGMVPDIAKDEETVQLTQVEDSEGLAKQVQRMVHDTNLREQITTGALKKVQEYTWDNIARRYWEELYRPLL